MELRGSRRVVEPSGALNNGRRERDRRSRRSRSSAVPDWPVTLRSGALLLRPLARRDERKWLEVRARNYAWLHEWDATTPPGFQEPISFKEMVAFQERTARAGDALPWVMAWDAGWPERPQAAKDTQIIGQVIVSAITYGSARSARIGYWIDELYAGNGLTPVGVALAVDYCWTALRLHRLEIDIRPENAPSLRVVEKLGFRHEGTKQRSLHIGGDWHDHFAFAIDTADAPDGILARALVNGVPGDFGTVAWR